MSDTSMSAPTYTAPANESTWVRDNLTILGEDQLAIEGKVATLERNQKVMFIGLVAVGASVALSYKAIANLMKGTTNLAQMVMPLAQEYQMRQHPSAHTSQAPNETVAAEAPSGVGYDPGVRETPERVVRLLRDDPPVDPDNLKGDGEVE